MFVIPTILGVSIIMFFLLFVAPGDPLATLLPPNATAEDKAKLAEAMGLDKPVYVQYGIWLSNAVQGDLGRSFHNNVPVFEEVTNALKNTFILAFAAAVLSLTAGVVLGTIAAFNQGRLVDKIASAIAITGLSLPNYWVAILLIVLFSVTWSVLPAQGMQTIGGSGSGPVDIMKHMVIPVIALMMISVGIITRMVRTSVLEVLDREWVTALRAKGLEPPNVVIHVLKNAAPAVITVVGLDFGYLVGGSILVESVVNWPGAGGLLTLAIQRRDILVVQGTVLTLATIFVVLNLIVDILNTFIDPRIRRT